MRRLPAGWLEYALELRAIETSWPKIIFHALREHASGCFKSSQRVIVFHLRSSGTPFSCTQDMSMKNITLSADAGLSEAARERARTEHSTLNDQFRLWLADYVQRHQPVAIAMSAIADLQSSLVTGGRKFTRDEMNER